MIDARDSAGGRPVLVALAGLPGSGKTTLAHEVAARLDAVHLRIDTIEAALAASGLVEAAGGWQAAPDAGYRVARAIHLTDTPTCWSAAHPAAACASVRRGATLTAASRSPCEIAAAFGSL